MSAKKKQKVPFPSLITRNDQIARNDCGKNDWQETDELKRRDSTESTDKLKNRFDEFWCNEDEKLHREDSNTEDNIDTGIDTNNNLEISAEVDSEDSATSSENRCLLHRKRRAVITSIAIAIVILGAWNASEDVSLVSNIKNHLPWTESETVDGETTIDDMNGESQSNDDDASETNESQVDYTKKIEILEYDINYSQAEGNLESGVDTLIHVKNNNKVPIKGVQFTVAGKNGDNIENVNSGNSYFQGDGYVAAGKSGYIYSKMYMINSTPTSQGKLTLTDAYKSSELDMTEIATGTVTTFHKKADSYDVRIKNPSAETITANDSIIIVIQKDYKKLASSWGAGKLAEDLKPDQEVNVKKAIHNPGFIKFDAHKYEAFIIDKSRLRMQ